MVDFIDLVGASGGRYRFQRVSLPAGLPAIAGNFVYVRGKGPNPDVVCAGTGETLLNADKGWAEAVRDHGADALFVRRNVSWRVREQEHNDIVERYAPKLVAAEEFERMR